MSDSASLLAFRIQVPHLTHPHTHALAFVQSLSHDSPSSSSSSSPSSPSHTRHRRTTSTHTDSASVANIATTPASSLPSPPSHEDRPATALAVSSSPMPKLFKIEIASNGDCKTSNPVFYPSDLIHGVVHLHLDKPMTLPALKIVFRGESNYPSSKQQDHLDHHMRRLFSVAMTLWGSGEPMPENQWGILPAGNHMFPFTIQLPDKNLPASFDHPWLKNHYTLTAYYRRPNGLSKWQSKAKPINFMPLSTSGLEHGPIQESCPKMGTALLLSHPDLTPGGRVHVKLTAAAAIDRCHFSLSRHIRARINETTYKEDEVICHYERKSIPKGELSLVLPVPKITPPTTESSSALKITYSVQVSIWNERFFFKTESHNFDFPIVIRTLPSCDNRACEGLDWCEPSVDRPTFLTEVPMQPLPLYDAEQSPPTYSADLPAYDQVAAVCATMRSISVQDVIQDHDHDHHSETQDQDHQLHTWEEEGDEETHSQSHDIDNIVDRASIHSAETTISDVEGHEQLTPDHPHPHRPSCVYYVAPLDVPESQECAVHIESSLSLASAASSSEQPISLSSSITSQDLDINYGEGCSYSNPHPYPHARVVDVLKVQTVIESA